MRHRDQPPVQPGAVSCGRHLLLSSSSPRARRNKLLALFFTDEQEHNTILHLPAPTTVQLPQRTTSPLLPPPPPSPNFPSHRLNKACHGAPEPPPMAPVAGLSHSFAHIKNPRDGFASLSSSQRYARIWKRWPGARTGVRLLPLAAARRRPRAAALFGLPSPYPSVKLPPPNSPSHAYDVWAQPHLPLARAHDLSQKLTAQKYPILYHQPVRYHKTHIRVKKHMF